MFRDLSEILQAIIQLKVAIPISVKKVVPFQDNGEQCYRAFFPSDLDPSGEDSYVVSLSCILHYLANRVSEQHNSNELRLPTANTLARLSPSEDKDIWTRRADYFTLCVAPLLEIDKTAVTPAFLLEMMHKSSSNVVRETLEEMFKSIAGFSAESARQGYYHYEFMRQLDFFCEYLTDSRTVHEDASVAAIQFALQDDEGIEFLRCWNEGDFDAIRAEWPDAPEDVYIGADPLYQSKVGTLARSGAAVADNVIQTAESFSAPGTGN